MRCTTVNEIQPQKMGKVAYTIRLLTETIELKSYRGIKHMLGLPVKFVSFFLVNILLPVL